MMSPTRSGYCTFISRHTATTFKVPLNGRNISGLPPRTNRSIFPFGICSNPAYSMAAATSSLEIMQQPRAYPYDLPILSGCLLRWP